MKSMNMNRISSFFLLLFFIYYMKETHAGYSCPWLVVQSWESVEGLGGRSEFLGEGLENDNHF